MPCSICRRWIPAEGDVYTANGSSAFGGVESFILRSLDGAEMVSVAKLDVDSVSRELAVRKERVEITSDAVPSGFLLADPSSGVVHIRAEALRWRRCEAEPCNYPPFIHLVSWCFTNDTWQAWYFICDSCRDSNTHLEHYSHINFNGEQSRELEKARGSLMPRQVCLICDVRLSTRSGYWQIWVPINAETGRIIADPAGSWLSGFIGEPFPRWEQRARHCLFADLRYGSTYWAYVCPACAQSAWWCREYLD